MSTANAAEAVEWLGRRYKAVEASFLRPAGEARVPVELRLEEARRSLSAGVDVQWGFWLTAGRFATIAVVCCSPNRHARYPCPAG
ncbi:hypothetical protein ABGB17_15305 [Sphaerisporangium sp. B11E5]|uniref:hypothetical protein n=1 Tax=Sphaerisporangium sp. B11E5 TaxID=3153563 RepID=UPI00325CA8C0